MRRPGVEVGRGPGVPRSDQPLPVVLAHSSSLVSGGVDLWASNSRSSNPALSSLSGEPPNETTVDCAFIGSNWQNGPDNGNGHARRHR